MGSEREPAVQPGAALQQHPRHLLRQPHHLVDAQRLLPGAAQPAVVTATDGHSLHRQVQPLHPQRRSRRRRFRDRRRDLPRQLHARRGLDPGRGHPVVDHRLRPLQDDGLPGHRRERRPVPALLSGRHPHRHRRRRSRQRLLPHQLGDPGTAADLALGPEAALRGRSLVREERPGPLLRPRSRPDTGPLPGRVQQHQLRGLRSGHLRPDRQDQPDRRRAAQSSEDRLQLRQDDLHRHHGNRPAAVRQGRPGRRGHRQDRACSTGGRRTS
jgi:hypothetical protein